MFADAPAPETDAPAEAPTEAAPAEVAADEAELLGHVMGKYYWGFVGNKGVERHTYMYTHRAFSVEGLDWDSSVGLSMGTPTPGGAVYRRLKDSEDLIQKSCPARLNNGGTHANHSPSYTPQNNPFLLLQSYTYLGS